MVVEVVCLLIDILTRGRATGLLLVTCQRIMLDQCTNFKFLLIEEISVDFLPWHLVPFAYSFLRSG